MWASLRDQVDLADTLFGDRGRDLIGVWLDLETARIDDPAFARLFADNIDLPGVVAPDYNHRHVRTLMGSLLGGIRFYGRDIGRPFVEVIGHDFDDLDALGGCVASEWAQFAPRFLRVRVLPGTLRGPNILLDNTIHAARYRDMPAPSRAVELTRFADVEEAFAMVAARYAVVATENPILRRNVGPATEGELAGLHERGLLRAARLDGTAVGLLGAAPGAITWLEGDEVIEEVVDARYAGRGLASAMQGEWARSVAVDPDRMLIGTIDRHNVASRRSAERAGRPTVLDGVFVALPYTSPAA